MLVEICMQEDGHRVRLATHANFKDFVLGAGLEFFPLGGDPKILAGCKCSNILLILSHFVLLVSLFDLVSSIYSVAR